MFQLQFNNEVTVFVDTESGKRKASACHPYAGMLKVKGFENRCATDDTVSDLTSEELVRYMDKASRMRFTEEGDQCIAFFDF